MFKNYLETKGFSAYTIKRYVDKVSAFEAWCSKAMINPSAASYGELTVYLEYLRGDGLGSRSCAAAVAVLRHYYDYLMSRDEIDRNPTMHIKVKTSQWRRPYEILTKKQLEALHSNYDTRTKAQHNSLSPYLVKHRKVTIGLMVCQGLESQSLAKLQANDVDLRQGRIYLRGGREYKERYIDLVPVQIIELHEYLKEVRPVLLNHYPDCALDLLLVHGGKTYHEVHKTIIKHLKAQEPLLSRLSGGAGRQIRASVITHWLKQYNLREVQYRSGYRNICSVEHYQKNDIETLKESMIKHYPLLSSHIFSNEE